MTYSNFRTENVIFEKKIKEKIEYGINESSRIINESDSKLGL